MKSSVRLAARFLVVALVASSCGGSRVMVADDFVAPDAPQVDALQLAAPQVPTVAPTQAPPTVAPVVAEVPATPAPEPATLAASDGSTFADTTTPAPVYATGVGGSCGDPEAAWVDGFYVSVFLRDASDVLAVSTEVLESPVVSIITTVPGEMAWTALQEDFAGSDIIDSLSSDDVFTGFELGIFSSMDTKEEELASLIDEMRSLPSAVVITDDRCIENTVPQLIDT